MDLHPKAGSAPQGRLPWQLTRQPDCRRGLRRGEEKAPDSAIDEAGEAAEETDQRRPQEGRRRSGCRGGAGRAWGRRRCFTETVLHRQPRSETGELGKAYWTEGRPRPW